MDRSFDELKEYYDTVLNVDKSTYTNTNDEPTPIGCVMEMVSKIPDELFLRPGLKILDPCCGNGNFAVVLRHKLTELGQPIDIHFNDINEKRLKNVKTIFKTDKITNYDFLSPDHHWDQYDLIVANPPYAKIMENGKRASKNHNLIKDFIQKSLSVLKPNGYLLFITPDNWMSYADRNTLIQTLTKLQIIHLDIHSAKKYFKKIGSSFTWYIIQNCPFYQDISVSGVWKKIEYRSSVKSGERKYIPLVYNDLVQSILSKTIDNPLFKKFEVKTSSDLHRYTKSSLISNDSNGVFKYRLIHTPSQTVYASRPHKFQKNFKVFISTTDRYKVFIDDCGMTQSIAFILCNTLEQATEYLKILEHPLYVFINNICRWGNFNNVRILQSFPIPENTDIYSFFKMCPEEIKFIEKCNTGK